MAGKIVEVEAYKGSVDEAAHTFRGKTKRNEVMFNEGGYLYIYFTYGVHHCANIVAGKIDEGDAILIRGIEPISGLETMCLNRFHKKVCSDKEIRNLTNGPGKICEAFDLNLTHNATDLTSDEIFLIDAPPENDIITTQRIGIKKSVDLPWRYYIKDNIYVSKK